MNKNKKTALTLVMIVLGMGCLTYAAFPLYSLFCKVTGYGGTTQEATALPEAQGSYSIKIEFNADISQDLPWEFQPSQRSMEVIPGKRYLAFYRATNNSDKPITGTATYNVTPDKTGIYFNKIQCFCFEEQTLAPGQTVDMPISFFIDPEIETNAGTQEVRNITLSYTFFKAVEK